MGFKQFLEEAKKSKAYIFDMDDTLIQTKSMVRVLDSQGKTVQSLSPKEFTTYKLQDGEKFDFDEFRDEGILNNTATKTPYWKIAQSVNDAVKRGESNSTLYILTARPPTFKKPLFDFLTKNGLDTLKLSNVYTVGDRAKGTGVTIAKLKKMSLKNIKKNHSDVKFFDDDDSNINLAKELQTIKTYKAKANEI